MKVSTRLWLLSAVLMGAIALIGAVAIWGIDRAERGLRTVYQDRVVPLRDLKVIADMYAVNIVDTTHKVRDGLISWERAQQNLAEAKRTIAEKWQAVLATYLVEEERRLVAEIGPLMKQADSELRPGARTLGQSKPSN